MIILFLLFVFIFDMKLIEGRVVKFSFFLYKDVLFFCIVLFFCVNVVGFRCLYLFVFM